MSGLLRRIRRTRPAATEPAPDAGAAWDEAEHPAGEQPGGGSAWASPDGATSEHGGGANGTAAIPAGTDLDTLVGERPTSKRRGRLRRRLRHLRRVREVLLRDLGGLMFEIHRSGGQTERTQAVLEEKLGRLSTVDAELRELAEILDDRQARVLREPGIGGTCPLCGELHGSDARFCWACGTPVAPGAVRPVVSTAVPALGTGAGSWTATPDAEPELAPEPDSAVTEPVIEGSSEDA
jgi:hypothetical protein